jgi:hypothetical protein
MKRLLTILAITGVLASASLTSCSLIDNQTSGSSGDGNNSKAQVKQLIIDDIAKYPRDPVEIKDARIVGDSLTMLVSYGGGCKTHDFKVISSGAIMKSMPPQMNIVLSHDAHDDMCEALLTHDVTVGLHAIKHYATSGGIVLHLEGFDQPLMYQR